MTEKMFAIYILPPNFVVPASLLHTFVCSGILLVNSCFLILTAQSITGKSILLLEKTDLKEMDILMGRRLELYEKIKCLDSNKQAVDNLYKKDSNGEFNTV